MKLPAIQFYTNDWLNEPGLRLSSLAARGIWMDMLCIMSAAQPRGYLRVGDKIIDPTRLARLVGAGIDEVTALLEELKEQSVYSVDEHGCIFSRRIVRDERIRKQNSKNGKRGGNPLLRDPGKPPLKPPLKPPVKRRVEDADEVEAEDEDREKGPGKTANGDDELDSEIRRWIGAHRMLTWDLRTHGKCRKLVGGVGWDRAKELIEQGIQAGASFPIGWALGASAKSEQAAAAAAPKRRNRHEEQMALIDEVLKEPPP